MPGDTILRTAYLLSVLLVANAPKAVGQEPPTAVALVGATIIDVTTGTLEPAATVVIQGTRIIAVGPTTAVRIPGDARVIDARGRYMIPGLIDTHVHLEEQWVMQPADTLAQLSWFVAGGVTTVREASAFYPRGNRPHCSACVADNLIALREASEAGRFLAPRIHLSALPAQGLREHLGVTRTADAIERYREIGIDAVKVTNQPPGETLRIIREARVAGVPVWGHTTYFAEDGGLNNYTLAAVHAGISGVSHMHYIYLVRPERDRVPPRRRPDGEWRSWRRWRLHLVTGWLRTEPRDVQALIAAMVSRGVWLEPSLTALRLEWDFGRHYASALGRFHTWVSVESSVFYGKTPLRWWQRRRYAAAWRAMGRFVRDFHEAGGTVVASSDHSDPFPPLGVAEEMRLLVEVGLPPLAALQASTINAARALGLDDQLGTVEEGKLADLVLLEGNPLADINNVRTVAAVVANGRLIPRQELDGILMRRGTPTNQ